MHFKVKPFVKWPPGPETARPRIPGRRSAALPLPRPESSRFDALLIRERNNVESEFDMGTTTKRTARRAAGSNADNGKRVRAGHQWFVALVSLVLTMGCDRDPGSPDLETEDATTDAARMIDAAEPRPVSAEERAVLATPLQPDQPPRLDVLLGANGAGLASSAAAASSSVSTCTVGFADYIGLLIIPQKAGHTFATNPYYIQGCGTGWVHVKENDVARYGSSWGSGYNHYHLMYEKGGFCVPSGGSYGYHNGSTCVNVLDPATEPRYLASHHGTQWIRIYVYRSGVPEMTFDFKSIRVKGTQGIKLYFRKTDGSWWHWNNLGPGTWNVAPYAAGIREILIRASGGSSSSYSFDNVVVGVS